MSYATCPLVTAAGEEVAYDTCLTYPHMGNAAGAGVVRHMPPRDRAGEEVAYDTCPHVRGDRTT